ncbi:hypothetical protein ACSTIF_00380, partial [Vibrio parahaemolyticus]
KKKTTKYQTHHPNKFKIKKSNQKTPKYRKKINHKPIQKIKKNKKKQKNKNKKKNKNQLSPVYYCEKKKKKHSIKKKKQGKKGFAKKTFKIKNKISK